ncbi:Biotin transport ATP-binding protein BioM [Arthrobacter saudimassiliensis]|uniref:Biotin transport ATP-binding protein BioM n=1 Tax=Arthrobacter saudimassiliensis TaxID=1461584 RepID=A0A078MP66_9MICC|nr:Biotin transport ATP-binding protein BioM [Arthrobacter saudimassiliensis]
MSLFRRRAAVPGDGAAGAAAERASGPASGGGPAPGPVTETSPAFGGIVFDSVGVSVTGPDGAPRHLLQDVDLVLTEQRIAVIGANGSGKSTLLKLINGLVRPTSGTVRVVGLDVAESTAAVRRAVGFVFTDPLSQLVLSTGRDDVDLSLRRSVPDRRQRAAAVEARLDRLGLLPLADQSIYDLSGGERQLMALAGVLAVDPAVLLADEPSTLLDLRNTARLRSLFAALPQQVLWTTHDLDFAGDADRILVVEEGRIVFDGAPGPAIAEYRARSAQAGAMH